MSPASLCGKQPAGSNGGVAVEQDKMQRSPVDLVELVDKALFFDKNAGADIARLRQIIEIAGCFYGVGHQKNLLRQKDFS